MNRALVIVHAQRGFAKDSPTLQQIAREIVQHAQQGRDTGDFTRVIATRFVNQPDCNYYHCVAQDMLEEDEIALVDGIADVSDAVCDGSTYDAATPELVEDLRSHAVDEVEVVGADTDQCVLATALRLSDLGFRVTVAEELCCSTAGVAEHRAGLLCLSRALGKGSVVCM